MGFIKASILKIEKSYSVNLANRRTEIDLLIGSEIEGPNYILRGHNHRKLVLNDAPGGTMTILPVPGKEDHFVSIMGMYPPFIAQGAGVYYHKPASEPGRWHTRKILKLPFAHRLEIIEAEDGPFLLAATVARDKADPSDWSHPGKIYTAPLNEDMVPEDFSIIVDSLIRNHGMIACENNGESSVLVSGKEGIFRIVRRPEEHDAWKVNQIFCDEVSEMMLVDLDKDGSVELVTIEPFHGNKLRVYKGNDRNWTCIFEDDLEFGHGLWAGDFNGYGTIFVGNRAGDCDLVSYQSKDGDSLGFNREVVEENTGTTQILVYKEGSESVMVASNPLRGEVAKYRYEEDGS